MRIIYTETTCDRCGVVEHVEVPLTIPVTIDYGLPDGWSNTGRGFDSPGHWCLTCVEAWEQHKIAFPRTVDLV